MTVVAADGQDVRPVDVEEFRIGVAETYDVIVEPQDERAYTIFSQAMDRSGFARATLAPRAGMQADVPAVDRVQLLGRMRHGRGQAPLPARARRQQFHAARRGVDAAG
ncbi:hypothetical protein G6F63_016334 [Rhizopus arrhizus]|nr:hypothetical protein G6F63_016334 [Rhizopus arrhizus]